MGYSIAQVSSGLGNVVAVDAVNGQEFQRIKIDLGNEGQSIPVTGSIPVTIQNSSITVGSLGPLIGTQSVSGSVNVGNLPSTQSVSGTVSQAGVWNVGITNTVPISGNISATVSFPATQAVSGSVIELPLTTITNSIISAITGSVTLLAANSARRSFSLYNASGGNMYVRFGSGANSTNYNLQLIAGAYFESTKPVYTGILTASFATISGSAFVGEGS